MSTLATANRIDRFLKLMNDKGASDLHLSVGRPPIFRLSGRMDPVRYRVLDDRNFESLVKPITPVHLWEQYIKDGDTDYAYEIPGVSRFRVNLFKQHRGMGAVFRIIPTKLMTIEQLGLPPSTKKFVTMEGGLVLVTGPTGSGKSTTLSAIINEINATRPLHMVTIEDPIEFVHPNKNSLVSQREIGPHSRSFSAALRAAVREDPDVILVGEMRDLETIQLALSAAETGVLVFGTLHTNSAATAIDRIIDAAPEEAREQVRGILSVLLRGILAQHLVKRASGEGRVAVLEILLQSFAVSHLIREGKVHQIDGLLQSSENAGTGMVSLDTCLLNYMRQGLITVEDGLRIAKDPEHLRQMTLDIAED